MIEHHNPVIAKAEQHRNAAKITAERSVWKPLFHVSPPAGWMNDPNGFIYFQGAYHLFYQHHPFAPVWGPMYWGHVKSTDGVKWKHLPIALAPDQEYDIDGCFSGSAIEADGKLHLMYTGNVWTGPDQSTDLKQVQCMASSEDGIHFTKWEQNPVISEAPQGDIHPHHFRDPKVWKKGDIYYCVIGSRSLDEVGQALLYRSVDLQHWEFVNVLARGKKDSGYMWECPDLFEMDGTGVLVLSPQGIPPQGYLYHNKDDSGYYLGRFNEESGTLEHGEFHLLDYGFDFYAPQTTVDDKGRRMMIAWMNMWESDMPEQAHEWAGAMTLPRQLILKEDRLLTFPAEELCELRRDAVVYEYVTIAGKEPKQLNHIEGESYELKLAVEARKDTKFSVMLRCDASGREQTVLTWDAEEGVLILDREHAGKGPGGVRKAPLKYEPGKPLELRIFVDRSSVEVFTGDGKVAMTARIYPQETSRGIRFAAEQQTEIISLEKWNMQTCMSND